VYFTLRSRGFILGIANCYHGYNNVSLLSGNGTEFREVCYPGSPLQYEMEKNIPETNDIVMMNTPCDRIFKLWVSAVKAQWTFA
jgi:hypothetical protein